MLQQFVLHLQAPVLTFGNPSAPHRLGEIVNWGMTSGCGRTLDRSHLMERFVCMVLFVGGGWLLRSKPMCDWNAKRQRISRGKEALMARIIEFYVPAKFQRRKPLIAQSQKGKVVVFCAEAKKPA